MAEQQPTERTRDGVITIIFELRDAKAVITGPIPKDILRLRHAFLLLLPLPPRAPDPL